MKNKIKKFLEKGNICNQDNRKNAGITLVALIITIIVLLILAGITLAMVVGDNGIITKAQMAKDINEYTSAKEELNLTLISVVSICEEKKIEYSMDKIIEKIKNDNEKEIIKMFNSKNDNIEESVQIQNPTDIVVIVNKYKKYKFLIGKIEENDNIVKIKGVTTAEITNTISINDFISIEEFEKNIYSKKTDTYIINYDADGDKDIIKKQTGNTNAIVINNNIPKKEGFLFLGWSTSKTNTTDLYYNGNIFTFDNSNNVTLYAVFGKQVEYIESTGTEYIDTGVYATDKTIVEAELYTTETGNKNWFGGSGYSSPHNYAFNSYNSTAIEYAIGNKSWTNPSAANVVGKKFIISFGKEIKINDIIVESNSNINEFQDDKTICIFVRNGGSAYIKGKVYHFKIYNDGVLLRDFIPLLDENNVACLYDIVEHKIYYNKGKGQFKYRTGEFEYVDYIENANNQWIDTGVYATDNTIVEAELYTTETGNKNWFGGSENYAFNSMSKTSIEYSFGNSSWKEVAAENIVSSKFKVSFGKKIKINDNTIVESAGTTTFQDTKSICLFVRNGGSAYIKGKIYYLKIYEGEELLRDFVPVLESNGTVCLYDKIEQKFYYSKGNGNFQYQK